MTVSAAWAAVAPRAAAGSGSAPCRRTSSAVARDGIEQIAAGNAGRGGRPGRAGAAAAGLGSLDPTDPPFPAGGAFAAYVLGFAPSGTM